MEAEDKADSSRLVQPFERRYAFNCSTEADDVNALMSKFYGTVLSPVGERFVGRAVDDEHAATAFAANLDNEIRCMHQDCKTGKLTASAYVIPMWERPPEAPHPAYRLPTQQHRGNWPVLSDAAASAPTFACPSLGVCLDAMVVYNPEGPFCGTDWHIALVGKFIAPSPKVVRCDTTGVQLSSNHVFVILATDQHKYADIVYDVPNDIKSFVRSMARGSEGTGHGNSLAVAEYHYRGEHIFEKVKSGIDSAKFSDAEASAAYREPWFFLNILNSRMSVQSCLIQNLIVLRSQCILG